MSARAQKPPPPVSRQWAAIVGTTHALESLWRALFAQLAGDAGIAAPTRTQVAIAAYDTREGAEAMAGAARNALGVEANVFESGGGARWCCSLRVGRAS